MGLLLLLLLLLQRIEIVGLLLLLLLLLGCSHPEKTERGRSTLLLSLARCPAWMYVLRRRAF